MDGKEKYGERFLWTSVEPMFSYGRQEGFAVYHHFYYEESSVNYPGHGRSGDGVYETIEAAMSEHPKAEVTDHCTKPDDSMPDNAPDWFDPMDAGEEW
jgi:hypothetical protein